jgi:hypothetical protein
MSLGGKVCFGQDPEQRSLAYLGQADNAGFHKWLLALALGFSLLLLFEFQDGIDGPSTERQTTLEDKRLDRNCPNLAVMNPPERLDAAVCDSNHTLK